MSGEAASTDRSFRGQQQSEVRPTGGLQPGGDASGLKAQRCRDATVDRTPGGSGRCCHDQHWKLKASSPGTMQRRITRPAASPAEKQCAQAARSAGDGPCSMRTSSPGPSWPQAAKAATRFCKGTHRCDAMTAQLTVLPWAALSSAMPRSGRG